MESVVAEILLKELCSAVFDDVGDGTPESTKRVDDAKAKVLSAMSVNGAIITAYVELHMSVQVMVKRWNNNQQATDNEYGRFIAAFVESSKTLQKHTQVGG